MTSRAEPVSFLISSCCSGERFAIEQKYQLRDSWPAKRRPPEEPPFHLPAREAPALRSGLARAAVAVAALHADALLEPVDPDPEVAELAAGDAVAGGPVQREADLVRLTPEA